MSVYLAPTFGIGYQGFSSAGLPLNAGKLYTYIAGGTTPQATYTTYLGNVQNSNPITLDSSGRPSSEIWLTNGVSYRIDLKDSLGNLIKTYDNVSMSSFVSTSDLAASSGSTLVGFIQGGTSPTAETVQTALRRIVYPEQFGAVGNGSTDDLTPLTNFINYLLANTQVEGRFLAKTYAISAALPTINVNGVRLIGFGPSYGHDVGTLAQGTVIKKIGVAGGTLLTIAPDEGVSGQMLTGIVLKGITFNCSSSAAKGVVIKSIRYSELDIAVFNATTTGLELNVATTLGEGTSSQFNYIRYMGRQVDGSGASGISMRLIGDANGNTSFNTILADVVHYDGIGIIHENSDNNYWAICRVIRSAGGSATNSIEWRGGTTSALSCRSETYGILSTTVAAIAKGTGTYTVGAQNIVIDHLDAGNSTPTPTEETGTTIFDYQWRDYTPVATAATGTFTTVTAAGRYRREIKRMGIELDLNITTNGTANGSAILTLKTASGSSSKSQTLAGIETATTGVMLRGLITAGASTCIIQAYDTAYPGANGKRLQLAGVYETD